MKKFVFIFLLTVTACNFFSDNEERETTLPGVFTGKVVGLADGDSFVMIVNNREVRVRMHGIDAPERRQDYSRKAKEFLSRMIYGKTVRVETVDIDRYGRVVGEVYVDGKHVNAEMVKNGYAWHYKHYSNNKDLARWEDSARRHHLGLWQQPHPVPPWEWRKMKREGILEDTY